GNVLHIAQPLFLKGGRAGSTSPGGEKLGGVHISFTVAPVQQQIAQFRRASLIFGLLFALAGAILSAFVGTRIVSPIGNLVKGTTLIASGNLDVHIAPSERDELGLLAESFNQMAASLKQNEATLRRMLVENTTLYRIGQQITAQVSLEPTLK